ncbi:MAG: hypothetical protein ABIR17_05710 [Pseudolysinimonas sp.]|uniref:hypothetical protein n=1 Tax=Pseudolysinimonas sp. TaxID=2680009 RepID=UPI003267FC02
MNSLPAIVWVFTGLLLFLAVTCVAASRGAIRLNHLWGIRIRSVMRTDATWRAGHAAGVAPAAIAFVVALACSVIGLAVPLVDLGAVVAFVSGVVAVVIRASSAADRVTAARSATSGS